MTLRLEPLSVETARELMDFGGGAMSPGLATEQLEGAVSVHNLLAREGFAYLADEVGMGKTYVALGAVALLRFFHPHLRVLYIAPRENIQTKWRKELQNFVRNNWKWVDQRVKDFEQAPAVDVALCSNMADWARQAVRAPDRDFLVRMTSFSFPLSDDTDLWKKKRDEIRNLALFVDPGDLDLRDKDAFKVSYAQAVNVLLPHYDLVVVDEAHNFKHGRKSGAARNRVLRHVLGFGDEGTEARLPGYGRRADRVLFLSATPLESDYEELWRQLDLFGFGERAPKLRDPALGDAEKKAEASRFLVRRLTGLRIGNELHTKNMYRREWRGGGCLRHDEALEVPDARQKLVVALVQKKVAEILRDDRFGACFQMGMLASFESFFRTAKVKTSEETGNFDATEQTEDELEKEGIDTAAIDQLARSYRREFKEALPHPKMDALVESLASGIGSGEKTLVFVRRVKSVDEIVEKLCRKYDAWLRTALLEKVPASLHQELMSAWNAYEEERWTRTRRSQVEGDEIDSAEAEVEEGLLFQPQEEDDPGGNDTFFAWFFRGEGPEGWLSGAAFRKNRLMGTGSAYSTFFEDNFIGAILGDPEDALASLAAVLGQSEADCAARLQNLAYTTFRRASRQKTFPRLHVFHAYQAAGLVLLASSKAAIASEAKVVLRERYPGAALQPEHDVPSGFPEPREYVNARTFFTELRRRPELRGELWPDSAKADFRDRFREMEQRRELLSGTARLGHAFLDLWALAVARMGSLKRGAQEKTGERSEALIGDYLDLLESQRGRVGFHAYRELSEVTANHELILSVNFSEVIESPLNELSRLFGRALAKQNPIGGMFGGVNATLVRQFRMPGYPLVLVTTEVLQEGEDLHTFCSRVVHYGITWTPAGMEQRTGRVDRIGSLAHRTLDGRPALVPEELLQVYYPYLGDTVERLQVERLLEKMNRFLRMIHRTGEEGEESRIFTKTEFLRRRDTAQITERLESSFPVRKDTLLGARPEIGKPDADLRLAREDLRRVAGEISRRVRVDWDEQGSDTAMYGTAFVEGERLLLADDSRKVGENGIRQQPFAFHLRSAGMSRSPVLHCVSPVGDVRDTEPTRIIEFQEELHGVKLSEVSATEANTYTLMAEGDVIFTRESAAVEDVFDLLERVAVGADLVERTLLGGEDAAIEKFREDLRLEAESGRD